MNLLIHSFPDDLHRRAKVAAAVEGTTLRDFVERAVAVAILLSESGREAKKYEAAAEKPAGQA